MPWTIEDPPAPAKNWNAEQKRVCVEVANKTLSKTGNDGMAVRACIMAVKNMSERFAEWTTAFMNDLPDSSFLYIAPGGEKDEQGKTKPRNLRYFPYKDASGKVDLPHLRNAIARAPQSSLSGDIIRRVQAKARSILESQQGNESILGKDQRLFNESTWEFGEIPDWIQVIPGPGKWDHPKYGAIQITPSDLQEFKRNFDQGIYQEHIPIDAEHETKLSGAVGYYSEVKVTGPNGEPGLWAKVDWNERGSQLLSEERFRYFSPEWYDSWEDPATNKTFKNVLVGGALTTRPFFKEKALIPLVASEGYIWRVEGEEWEEMERVSERSRRSLAYPKTGGGMNITLTKEQVESIRIGESIEFTEEQMAIIEAEEAQAKVKQATEADPAVARRFAEMEAINKRMAEELKQATARIAGAEKESRRRTFVEEVKVHRMGYIGTPEEAVDKLEVLHSKLSPEEFQAHLEERRTMHERLAASDLFKQKSTEAPGPNSIEGRIMAEAKDENGQIDPDKIDPAEYAEYNRQFIEKTRRGGA